MSNKLSAATAVLMACAATGASAVNLPGAEGTYAFGGGLVEFGDSGRNSDQGLGGHLGLGLALSPNNALELEFSGLSRDRDDLDQSDQQLALRASYVRDFGRLPGSFGLTPFVSIGVAAFDERVVDNDVTAFGGSLGAGLLLPIFNNRFAVRSDALAQLQANDESIPGEDAILDFQVRIGIQIPFSPAPRRYAPARPPPETPSDQRELTPDARDQPLDCAVKEVDPVTGKAECVYDTDLDGVDDNLDRCPDTPGRTLVDVNGCKIEGSVDSDDDGILDDVDACPATISGLTVDATGCVVAQTATLRAVNFESGSARLTENAKLALVGVARTLKNQKNLLVGINGHTDDVGNDDFNLALSSQRAKSVRQYLILKGVPGRRLTATGYGETSPVADNQSEAGRLANRRVEFKVSVQ